MKKVSFYTFGCKLNQTETSYLDFEFNRQGYQVVPFNERSDYVVINTCTVTARTDYKCRQVIRRAQKNSPNAVIAVVGCYAQMAPEVVKNIPGVNLILGSDSKFDIFNHLDSAPGNTQSVEIAGDNEKFIDSTPGQFGDQTRAFLKIQDGCNSFCSYCIVPYARGGSRSDVMSNVIRNTKKLIANGYQEIVLTGVHIGKYGYDLNPQVTLPELIDALIKLPGLGRIRLSSLEPIEIDDRLIERIADNELICPHFHIPLQNGDDEILQRMRRNYSVADFRQLIEKIITKIPNAGLGTDVITGFPGETDSQFENTFRLIEALPFTYLHVFSYSERPGTRAANFEDKVPRVVIKERTNRLIALGKQKKSDFYNNAINQQLQVLFEEKSNGNWMYGFTENYIRVRTRRQPDFFNRIVTTAITSADQSYVYGTILQ